MTVILETALCEKHALTNEKSKHKNFNCILWLCHPLFSFITRKALSLAGFLFLLSLMNRRILTWISLLQNDTMNFPHIMTLKGLNTSNPGLS
jgi:hypothetical protein